MRHKEKRMGSSFCENCEMDYPNMDLEVRKTYNKTLYYCPECNALLAKFNRE